MNLKVDLPNWKECWGCPFLGELHPILFQVKGTKEIKRLQECQGGFKPKMVVESKIPERIGTVPRPLRCIKENGK